MLHVNETWIFIVCLFIGRGLFFERVLVFSKNGKTNHHIKKSCRLDILFPKSFFFKNRFCVMFGNSLTIWFYILKQLTCQCYWVIKIKTTAKSCKIIILMVLIYLFNLIFFEGVCYCMCLRPFTFS